MADVTIDLLKTHLRQLRLPTMGAEFERLARRNAIIGPILGLLVLVILALMVFQPNP